MIHNKKGLSAIVGTLLIILLVIVAVGIVWTVVRGTLQDKTADIDSTAACLESTVKVTAASCNATLCNVTVQRESGSDAIDGVRIIVSDGSNSNSTDTETNLATPNIATYTVGVTNLGTVTSSEAAIYVDDASGNPQICESSGEFTAGITNV